MEIGTQVETIHGYGVIEHIADYSVGRYYDVRMSDGSLQKFFHSEVSAL
jgi:hypothetical protein